MSEQQKEVLFAVRMNWLTWLGKPIMLLWQVIKGAALAFWRLVTITGTSMPFSYKKPFIIIGALGGSIFFSLLFLFAYISSLTGLSWFIFIGAALSILPIAWGFGETASVLQASEQKGAGIRWHEAPKGNGIRVAGSIALYVIIICLAAALQIATSLLSAVPGAGPSLLGIIMVPNVLLSIFIVLCIILLFFSIITLPGHLLWRREPDEQTLFKDFFSLNTDMLHNLRSHSYWLQLLIAFPLAVLFALIVSIPMIILALLSLFLSFGIGTISTEFSGQMGETLQALLSFFMGGAPIQTWEISTVIGMFFVLCAISILAGLIVSPFFTGIASAFYKLYTKRNSGKTWSLLAFVIITLVLVIPALYGIFSWIGFLPPVDYIMLYITG